MANADSNVVVTVGPGKDYDDLALAWTGTKGSTHVAPWFECYSGADLAATGAIVLTGASFTPTTTYYVKVYAAAGNRHDGTRSGTKGAYIVQPAGAAAINASLAHTRIEGIRVDAYDAGTSANGMIYSGSVDGIVVDSCLIVQMNAFTGTSVKRAISIRALAAGQSGTVKNCIMYGHASTTVSGASCGILVYSNAGVTNAAVTILNNSVYAWTSAGTAGGIWIQAGANNAGQFVSKNNMSFGNAKDYYWTDANSLAATTASNDMSGDATADDAGGSGHLINQTFANVCTSVNNLMPKAGSSAILAGTNPAILPVDAIGAARNAVGPDDIGALTTYVLSVMGIGPLERPFAVPIASPFQ